MGDLDTSFGHWFAGFTDGEGCFCIVEHKAMGSWQCSFTIALRADDRPLLESVQRQLGYGRIYDSPGRGSTKPYSRFVVGDKAGRSRITDLFTVFPLRSKKARDFEIWKRAVSVWGSGSQGNPNPGRWVHFNVLKQELVAGRVFVPALEQVVPVQPEPVEQELEQLLFGDIA